MSIELQRDGDTTTVEMLGQIAGSARELVAAHAAQVYTEMAAEWTRGQRAGERIGIGFGLFLTGIGFTIVGIVTMLIEQFGWSHTASWFTVGGTVAVTGATIWLIARHQWRTIRWLPERSWRSMQESLSWITNQPR